MKLHRYRISLLCTRFSLLLLTGSLNGLFMSAETKIYWTGWRRERGRINLMNRRFRSTTYLWFFFLSSMDQSIEWNNYLPHPHDEPFLNLQGQNHFHVRLTVFIHEFQQNVNSSRSMYPKSKKRKKVLLKQSDFTFMSSARQFIKLPSAFPSAVYKKLGVWVW